MIANIIYRPVTFGWRCHVMIIEVLHANVANDVAIGWGETKKDAFADALASAQKALAAVKAEAPGTRISYHHSPKALALPPWRCTMLSDVKYPADGVAVGHCVGQGWGETEEQAFAAALKYAEEALATVVKHGP